MKILEWLKWLVWGSWHGESVSAFDVRRTTQSDSPEVQIGRLRFPRWLIWLLVALLVVALIVLALRVAGLVLTTSSALANGQAGVFNPIDACTVKEQATGRMFVAIDCLLRNCWEWLWTQVPAFLVFGVGLVVGFVIGWNARGMKRKEE